MTSTVIPKNCCWWQPKTIEPLEAIRVTLECLETGETVPELASNHVAQAFRRYLAGETDLNRNLGLRPRRGHGTPLADERKAMRDHHIKKLFNAQIGRPAEKAKRTEHLLQNPSLISDAELRKGIERICVEYGHELPTSTRQILRIADIK